MKIAKTQQDSMEAFVTKYEGELLLDIKGRDGINISVRLSRQSVKKLKFFIDTFVLGTKKKGAKK